MAGKLAADWDGGRTAQGTAQGVAVAVQGTGQGVDGQVGGAGQARAAGPGGRAGQQKGAVRTGAAPWVGGWAGQSSSALTMLAISVGDIPRRSSSRCKAPTISHS